MLQRTKCKVDHLHSCSESVGPEVCLVWQLVFQLTEDGLGVCQALLQQSPHLNPHHSNSEILHHPLHCMHLDVDEHSV